jgi:signal transduction histidine kinase
MMHSFLTNNRDQLIAQCRVKVAQRPRRGASNAQLANGVPMFLDQVIRTLEAEDIDDDDGSTRISGASGGDALALSEIGMSATAHGRQLLLMDYSIDQVVHDYGDLCQAITDLAFERDAPFTVDEFRTLNRCLDNAIADAVTAFAAQRDEKMARRQDSEANERLGFLAHELRNALGTATLAVGALEVGNMTISGATGAVLKRSLSSLANLVDRALLQVRNGTHHRQETFSVASFIDEARSAAQLDAGTRGCTLSVPEVDASLKVHGNRELLLAALANLLQNAFKFSHACSEVTLRAQAAGEHVLIDVVDRCGGLPHGSVARMFTPFTQRNEDRSGLGLGLSIARQSVEDDGGTLGVRDMPGSGCVFTISLPRRASI